MTPLRIPRHPAQRRRFLTRGSPRVLLLLALVILAIVLLAAFPADARTLSGAEVGWTRLADRVLVSGSRLALVLPVIGLMLIGAAIAFGFSLPPAIDLMVAGALATLGGAAISSAFGAELPLHVLASGPPL
ncbi:hypothetical protein [Marinivivus vitaminiproducens]|uniref:hypothetical protein n=1 Tax=Marinivivus vitaminiproducens TaxID=3035935 RepID=UPI0027A9CD42|nr:hypothetical protein P4R82_24595 [Geminicoccaceae bacterium SCSIO 64248]